MIVRSALQLAADAVAATPTRPATAIAHDAPDARLLTFRIAPGQQVAPHTNPGTVVLCVLAGAGVVSGGDGEQSVRPGDLVAYARGELHGMRCPDDAAEPLVLLAILAPRPGTTPVDTGAGAAAAPVALGRAPER